MTSVIPDHVTATRHHTRAGLRRLGWRPLICGLLLALPLTGCGDGKVHLGVPSDPRVLHGEWSGLAQAVNPINGGTYPMAFHVVATPGNSVIYYVSGTMDLNGTTYTIANGHVTAQSETTFTAQSLPPRPYVWFYGPLVLDGETVGYVEGTSDSSVAKPTWGMRLHLNVRQVLQEGNGAVTRSAPGP